ncbi:MAG: YceI family protein, partial [Actinomycetota bacterium]
MGITLVIGGREAESDDREHSGGLGRIGAIKRERAGEFGEAAGTWQIDPTHSTVGFVARHAMIAKVRGGFTEFT